MNLIVPANCTATVQLPGAVRAEVTEGGRPLEEAEGVSEVSEEPGGVKLQVGSGSYLFRYRYA